MSVSLAAVTGLAGRQYCKDVGPIAVHAWRFAYSSNTYCLMS
jgi:hypothetical protein